MNPIDYAILIIVFAILGGAAFYIFRAKKQGQKCIGCPHSKTCGNKCTGCHGDCGGQSDNVENK